MIENLLNEILVFFLVLERIASWYRKLKNDSSFKEIAKHVQKEKIKG